jgi:hypothetical protein
VRCLPTASALPLKKDFGTSRLAALVSGYTTCPCGGRAEEHSRRFDTYHLNPRRNDPARPMAGIRARVAHRWRLRGLLCALQPVDLLIKLGDPPARALAASERLSASVRFRAVTGRPSRQLPRLGCARTRLMHRSKRCTHGQLFSSRLSSFQWRQSAPSVRILFGFDLTKPASRSRNA